MVATLVAGPLVGGSGDSAKARSVPGAS